MNNLNNKNVKEDIRCVLCGSNSLFLAKKGNVAGGATTSQHFLVTDSNYGKTFDIFRCRDCSLLQCSLITDTRSYYEKLEDELYEKGRDVRAVQMKKILKLVAKYRPSGSLLDIGAAAKRTILISVGDNIFSQHRAETRNIGEKLLAGGI